MTRSERTLVVVMYVLAAIEVAFSAALVAFMVQR